MFSATCLSFCVLLSRNSILQADTYFQLGGRSKNHVTFCSKVICHKRYIWQMFLQWLYNACKSRILCGNLMMCVHFKTFVHHMIC